MTRQTLAAPFRRIWPILALLILTLVFFHKLAFSGLILARGDTFNYFYPIWAARNAALIQGQLPLWSPDLFMGVPLLANPQLGTFYLPNWLVISLSPPDGIRISILLHVFWALLGTYALARRYGLNTMPALAASAVFGLGGYVGAHMEQINQLQGLSWLPWLFLLLDHTLEHPRRYVLLLAVALALQFLSGHTQTVFISGVGLGMYALSAEFRVLSAESKTFLSLIPRVRSLSILALAAFITLPLIAPQLIPTLELTSVSNRSGGLTFNEATSFSFNPLVAGRGLLPSYDGMLFGEFVAYSGIIGLGLALMTALLPRASAYSRVRLLWGIIALVGLLLAFGEFNPLYSVLARLPGFSFFRVPARWLSLFAMGVALLAGIGLQTLLDRELRFSPWRLVVTLAVIALLAVSTLVTPQEDVIGPAAPTLITWGGWGVAFVVLLGAFLYFESRTPEKKGKSPLRWLQSVPVGRGGDLGEGLSQKRNHKNHSTPFVVSALLTIALFTELFFASGVLPYNTLAPPETYRDQRFTISQLLAQQESQQPPGRLLSISGLLFDPGDKAALEARYRDFAMSDLAIRNALVATKRKEIAAPNLPLVWGIPSIDGFDGGLLPTSYYSAFSSLLLNDDPTVDGRLFETLAQEQCRGACVPDQRWLNLTHTRYLVTDKVYDLWHEDVAYDTQLSASFSVGDVLRLSNPTQFQATAVDVLFTGQQPILTITGDTLSPGVEAPLDSFQLARFAMNNPVAPQAIEITTHSDTTVHAATLVDTRTGDFAQLTIGPWQRLLSSDIKLYENPSVLPRAFVVHDVLNVPDTTEGTAQALELMRGSNFDPAVSAVIHSAEFRVLSAESKEPGAVSITHYTPTRIDLTVDTDANGYLILTDAYYSGWRARVNGEDVPIQRADVMFRVVPVAAGSSEIVFSYEPVWLPGALIVGGVAWVVWLVGVVWLNTR